MALHVKVELPKRRVGYNKGVLPSAQLQAQEMKGLPEVMEAVPGPVKIVILCCNTEELLFSLALLTFIQCQYVITHVNFFLTFRSL